MFMLKKMYLYIRYFRSGMKRKTSFPFAFLSLIRIFANVMEKKGVITNFVALLLATMVGTTASAKVNDEFPRTQGDKTVNQYQDSLALYKAKLDSLQKLQKAYTAFDKYRLFSSGTFYNGVAQQILSLSEETKDSVSQDIDNALLNIYLKYPELIQVSEGELNDAGAMRPQFKEPIGNSEKLFDATADALENSVVAPDPVVVVKKPNFWMFKGDYFLQFLQNYVSENWYKGGESNYSAHVGVTMEANYNNKQKVKWDNKLEMKVGFMTSRSDSLHDFKTSEDLIRLTSKFGLQATKNWYYTLQLLAYTQFTRGYKSNDPFVYSDFCSPLVVRPSLGMSYNVEAFNKRLTGSVQLSPFTYNFVYVGRLDLATRNGIDEGHHTLHDFGSSFTADLNWVISDNIKWKTRLYGFTSYDRSQIEWENTFSFQFNKYISTNLFIYPRFDDTSVRDDNMGYWQLMEYFSLGFNYSF